MKPIILITFSLALTAVAQDADASKKKVIPAAEITRAFNQGETRSFTAPRNEARRTRVSAEHLRALNASGATRGIRVIPDAAGQSQVTVNVNPDSSVTFQNILFQLNSTELADKASAEQVEQIAQAMLAVKDKVFVLEGHTCDIGTDASNLDLSERRAVAIFNLLRARGVPPERLLPLGFGESRPATPNTSEANREENRRVVISVQQE